MEKLTEKKQERKILEAKKKVKPKVYIAKSKFQEEK